MARFTELKRAAVDAAMRDEVYRTSVKILVEEGLYSLTLDRLATEIGVSRPTLYNYFSDRAGVVSFIEDRVFENLGAELERIAGGAGTAREKLEAICNAIIDCIFQERILVLALFHKEMLEGELKDARAARRQQAMDVIVHVLEQGMSSGELRSLPLSAASQVVFGALAGHVDGMIYSGNFVPAAEVVPPMLDVLLGGLERAG